MRDSVWIGAGALAVALSFAAVPVTVHAQSENQDRSTVTLKDVKNRLKENERFLSEARTKGKAGDAKGTQVALDNYGRGTQGLDRALSRGQFAGSDADREEAFERVEKATRKHGEVLTDLLGKVPEQARPAIEHALLEVSQRGREHAMANLEQAHVRREAAEQKTAANRQDGARRPDSIGGRTDGAGATGAGRPTGVGGKPPAGRPGKRP